MEDQVPVNKYAPTPLGHFHAAVCKDILNMDIPAMVMSFHTLSACAKRIHALVSYLETNYSVN